MNIAIVPPVSHFDLYGRDAPECGTCEGSGQSSYLHGPYETTRECPDCYGTGRFARCPSCLDGTTWETGDTCPTCDGYTSLH
ncbi:hypothetical protein ACGFRG_05365 [Streptomyces sp. NPDC048696]|uniref:hypothetical protein n=1 Tax=Streptomyces sp. NPDC048696 TaxID=3365585 RepID=UPI003721A09B